MSALYSILKKKAEDPKTKNKIALTGKIPSGLKTDINYSSVSYEELLSFVDLQIELFKNPNFTAQPISGRRKYIVVDNSVTSIAVILALLECGAVPVILDAKNIPLLAKDMLPYTDYGDMVKNGEIPDAIVEDYLKRMNVENELEGENEPGVKMIICSSGSEGLTPHIKLLREDELLNLPIQYGEKNGVFYSYVSCAHISGVLTNLVSFIVHDNEIMLAQGFDFESIYFASAYETFVKKNFERKYVEKRYLLSTANPELMQLVFGPESLYDGIYYDQIHIEGDELVIKVQRPDYQFTGFDVRSLKNFLDGTLPKPDSIMLPRDISNYLLKTNLEELDLSSLRHIYMAGGMNSKETIEAMREKIPSIQEGAFINLYGSTEANGVICYCNEEDLKTCYINIGDYESGRISYTYDQKTFYEIENGKVTEIPAPEDNFGYMPYLTVSSKVEPNITIDNMIDVMYQGQATGDVGIYIDDKLYILGRKSELIKLNGKSYITNSIESYLSNYLKAEVFITPIDDVGIQPYIKVDNIENGEKIMEKYYNSLVFGTTISEFHVNPPVIIDDYIFEKSKISGKQPRALLKCYEKYASVQFEALKNGKPGLAEISKSFAKSFANYNIQIADDGCFISDVRRRFTIPMNDMIECFYKMIKINEDIVEYIPKDKIAFATGEHIFFSNNMAMEYLNSNLGEIFNMAFEAFINGEISKEKYRPVSEAKNPDEIFEILRHNIMYDFIRRYMNKIKYEKSLRNDSSDIEPDSKDNQTR